MSTTPRALGRAKALTAGAMLVAAVATGAVALHLADAQATTTAAGTTVDGFGTSSDASGTSSQSSSDDDSSSSDDDSSDDSTTSGSASTTTSNGFAPVAPPAPAQAPAQSSTNGS